MHLENEDGKRKRDRDQDPQHSIGAVKMFMLKEIKTSVVSSLLNIERQRHVKNRIFFSADFVQGNMPRHSNTVFIY